MGCWVEVRYHESSGSDFITTWRSLGCDNACLTVRVPSRQLYVGPESCCFPARPY